MKYGDVTFGQMEAIINKLGGMDGVRGFLSGALMVVSAAEKLLEFVGTIRVSVGEKFAAADHFQVNTSAMAEVRIGHLSDDFCGWFLGKTEKSIDAAELCYRRLRKASPDKPILDELGYVAETTLSMVWELLKLQPNGEGGALLVNGCANIFYVHDVNNTFRAVYVNWGIRPGAWGVQAVSIGDPRGWKADYRVFSRNS